VIVSPNLAYLEESKAKLANEFAMTNKGDLSYCIWYSNDAIEGIRIYFIHTRQVHFGYPYTISDE
jgi:hypothetical protein